MGERVEHPVRRKRCCEVTTLTFPLSRIEGHAQVVIEDRAGQVASARFQAMAFRGFEYFVHRVPAEQMPVTA